MFSKTKQRKNQKMRLSELYELYLKNPKVAIDSRKVNGGELFFAIRGERFDGNAYAMQALEKGAAYAIVDDQEVGQEPNCIWVEDALKALQDLARHHRRQFDIPIIGITGSNGKTTTKELVAEVLGSTYRLHFTQGNYNNHIGVPLTLLAMPEATDLAVIEMGANHQGEIDALSRIAEPSHGLITNIGKAHLEGFGGIEGVKKGKSELYRFLAERSGIAFVNQDERFLEDLAAPCEHIVFYHRSTQAPEAGALMKAQLLREQPYLALAFRGPDDDRLWEAQSKLIGIYNFGNILTAVALGQYFKVPGASIKEAIERYLPENMRTQVIERGTNVFLQDAYNANPTSMRGAIEAFHKMEAERRVLILGDMLELGEDSAREHADIGKLVDSLGFDQVILVGEAFQPVAEQINALHFPDAETLREWFRKHPFEHTHWLIKGSRSIRLEQVLE